MPVPRLPIASTQIEGANAWSAARASHGPISRHEPALVDASPSHEEEYPESPTERDRRIIRRAAAAWNSAAIAASIGVW